jgi:rSAM/selenodomain-associated transferase 2
MNHTMKISIIIPVHNEEATIERTIRKIRENTYNGKNVREIIVVDANSSDKTCNIAKKMGAIVIKAPKNGRARQMNIGGKKATGDIFYFIHADCIPPFGFDIKIIRNLKRNYQAGSFRLKFDDNHPILKIVGWLSQFNLNLFRAGDQSLFVEKNLFSKIGEFKSSWQIMEDVDIIPRLREETKFKIISPPILSSSRRYRNKGIIKLQLVYILIRMLHIFAVSNHFIMKLYKKLA